MDLSKKEIGGRIRNFRWRSGLTQAELANQMGFNSKQIISQIEKGDREVKVFELVQLSQLLSIELDDLLRTEKPQKAPAILWRDSPVSDKKKKEAEFIKHYNNYSLLEEMSGIKGSSQFPQKRVDPEHLSFGVARSLANDIRREFNLGDRPASVLEKTLEDRFGVKIWYMEMEKGSAASTIGPFGPAILMNSKEAPWRRNYNFGHELFHLITWDSLPPSLISKKPELWEDLERKANAFASSLLLPSDPVSVEFGKYVKNKKIAYSDLIEIARFFDVSTGALLYRLVNMKCIPQAAADAVLNDESFREKDKSTMAPHWWQPPGLPERFVRIAFVAFQKGKLSKAKLADLLNSSLIDLTDTLQEYGFSDDEGFSTEVPTT